AVILLGLVAEQPAVAVAGCCVAVLGRGTALPVALGVCVWWAVRRRPAVAAAALLIPVATFLIVKVVGGSFATANPSVTNFTIISPLLRLPGTAREIADHIGRVLVAAPAALAILGAAALVARRWSKPLVAGVFLAALVMVQPLLFNPDWVQ